MTVLPHTNRSAKGLVAVLLITTLGACSSTSDQVQIAPLTPTNNTPVVLIDQDCLSQASQMAQAAQTSGANAQYIMAARYMQSCLLQPLPDSLDKSESQSVMQLMANTTLSFIQGGDIVAAQQQLDSFVQIFPNQDLYLPNFTSFVDTATALLSGPRMSVQQLTSLNISRELREELERQQYWLSH